MASKSSCWVRLSLHLSAGTPATSWLSVCHFLTPQADMQSRPSPACCCACSQHASELCAACSCPEGTVVSSQGSFAPWGAQHAADLPGRVCQCGNAVRFPQRHPGPAQVTRGPIFALSGDGQCRACTAGSADLSPAHASLLAGCQSKMLANGCHPQQVTPCQLSHKQPSVD